MKRQDDYDKRRERLKDMSDEELYQHFWSVCDKVVEPLVELGKKNTSPSIERSVLLRMGISSLDTKAIVDGVIERGLMGKGAGNVVYKLSQKRGIDVREAGRLLAGGEAWDEAAALFRKA